MITGYGSLLLIGLLVILNLRSSILNFLKFLRIFLKTILREYISSDFILLLSTEVVAVIILTKHRFIFFLYFF